MKLRKGDNVLVITGRDKGKTGEITTVLPRENKVIVDGINVVKRHTKPSQKFPQGGILDITKPVDVSKLMVIDPQTGKPSRVGFRITKDGSKERVFKPSRYEKPKQAEKAKAQKAKASDKPAKAEAKQSDAKTATADKKEKKA